jgi:hypothetical protein
MVARVDPALAVWIVLAAVLAVTTVFYSAISGRLRRDEAVQRTLKELPSDEEQERERDEELDLLFDEGTRSQTLRKLQGEKEEAEHGGPPKPPPDRWD